MGERLFYSNFKQILTVQKGAPTAQ